MAALSALGCFGGPVMGCFLLGFFCPNADGPIGLIAFLLGNIVSAFFFIGRNFIKPGPGDYENNPLFSEDCLCNKTLNDVSTFNFETSTPTAPLYYDSEEKIDIEICLSYKTVLYPSDQVKPEKKFVEHFYHISYLHLGSFGLATVFISGWFMAFFKVKCLKIKSDRPDDRYLHPILRNKELDI